MFPPSHTTRIEMNANRGNGDGDGDNGNLISGIESARKGAARIDILTARQKAARGEAYSRGGSKSSPQQKAGGGNGGNHVEQCQK